MSHKALFPVLVVGVFFTSMPPTQIFAADVEERVQDKKKKFDILENQNKQILDLLQHIATSTDAKPTSTTPNTSLRHVDAKEEPTKPQPIPARPTKPQYQPGWLARIYALPIGFVPADDMPSAEIGKFVATKSIYSLNDYIKLIGMTITGKGVMWQGQGFLHATEAGSYVFSLNTRGNVYGAIYVGGKLISDGLGQSVINAVHLNPGLYQVEFRAAGTTEYGGSIIREPYNPFGFDFRIKTPSADVSMPAEKVLLIEK